MRGLKTKIVAGLIVLGTAFVGMACEAAPRERSFSYKEGRKVMLKRFPKMQSIQDTTWTIMRMFENPSRSHCFCILMYSKESGIYMACAYDNDGSLIYNRYTKDCDDAEWFYQTALEIIDDYNEMVYNK